MTAARRTAKGPAHSIFDRVASGVDRSEESLKACRQAVRLCRADGVLEPVAVFDGALAVRTGWNAPRGRAELEHDADVALERARDTLRGPARVSLLVV